MAEEVRDVRARLIVERSGEKDAFRDAADDVADLAPAASRAGDAVADLEDILEHTTRAVESFAAKSEKGLEGTENAAVGARGALIALRAQVDAARSAGGAVSDADLAKLEQLEGLYDDSTARVGAWRKVQQDAKRDIDQATAAVGGQVQQINSLDDLFKGINPKVAEFAVKWGVASAAVGVASAALQEVRETANAVSEELTGKKIEFFDPVSLDGLRGMVRLAKTEFNTLGDQIDAFATTQGSLTDKLQAATDAMHGQAAAATDEATAVDLANTARERYLAAVEKARGAAAQATADQAKELDNLRAAVDRIAAGLDPAVAAQQQYEATTRTLNDALAANLINHERYGALLAAAAEKRDAATKKENEAATATANLAQQVAALLQVLSQTAGLDRYGAAHDTARTKVQEMVAAHITAGQQVPLALAQWAEKLGVVVGAMHIATTETNSFSGAQQQAERTVVQTSQTFTKTADGWKELGDSAATSATAATDASTKVGDATTKVTEQGGAASDAAAKIDDLAAKQVRLAEQAGDATTALSAQATELGQLDLSTYAGQLDAIATALDSIGRARFADGVVSELGRINTAAAATLAQLQQVASFGDAGGGEAAG